MSNDDGSIDRDFTFVYFVDVNGDRKHGGDEPSISLNIHIGYANQKYWEISLSGLFSAVSYTKIFWKIPHENNLSRKTR